MSLKYEPSSEPLHRRAGSVHRASPQQLEQGETGGSLGRVDETLLRRAGSRGVLDVRATGDARDAGPVLRALSDTGEAECASLKRRPKMFHASRELCCITLTSSCGEGNHAGAEESLLKRSAEQGSQTFGSGSSS